MRVAIGCTTEALNLTEKKCVLHFVSGAHDSGPGTSARCVAITQASATMRATSALLCALVGSASAALELTPDTFDAEVLQSGKAAFVKFLAPW